MAPPLRALVPRLRVLVPQRWRALVPRLRALVPRWRALVPRWRVLVRREVRFPGAFVADRRVSRWRDLLWGGASEAAIPALQAFCDGAGGRWANPLWAQLQASLTLAAWWDFQGDTDRALQLLMGLANGPLRVAQNPARIIPLAVLLQRTGQTGAARDLIAQALRITPTLLWNPDFTLIRANLAADDASRLTLINQIYTGRGFAPLAFLPLLAPDRPAAVAPDMAPDTTPDQPKVSVILPAFQAQECIAAALASLSAQTHANLEIIVVDDASTDDTAHIVDRLARSDPRIRVLRLVQNGGAYGARNHGLAQATGQFITTHDADDWSHPQKIATQIRALAHNQALMAVMTHWVRCRPGLQFTPGWRLSHRLIDWSHSSLLVRRAVFDRLGGWDEVRVSADTELIWRIEAAYGAGTVAKIHPDLPLAFARDIPGSLTRNPQTHARSIYAGLRHYYREISRYWQARYPQGLPPAAQAQRRAMLPAAMFGPDRGPVPDILLSGDLADPAVIAEARQYLARHPDPRCGISHRPDCARFRPTPTHAARFCDGFFALLQEGRLQIVLPEDTARIATRITLTAGGRQ